DVLPSYIHSYVERDVRQLINVENLSIFQKFLQLCAGRIGQLLNIAALSTECSISQTTAKKWLSLLEASYVLFLLRPYHVNFNKRVTKSPKLFFYDTGLASSLLKIRSFQDLALSQHRGHLFECLMLSDILKQYFNRGMQPPVYFWRDLNGRIEIDCLIDLGTKLIPIEIKSGSTATKNFFQDLNKWNKIAETSSKDSYVIYSGELEQTYHTGKFIGWKSAGNIVNQIDPQHLKAT
ncbi:DUF4143 domain-containing protein, partial [Candidatus Babeliales bacterium]|nr:DUF4143 domain-containing protein [Candidatus Babeliales bacterium]